VAVIDDLLSGWPVGSSAVVLGLRDGLAEVLAEAGDLEERRAWASVSKLAVALAFGVEHDWGLHDLTEGVGPRGATIADLLSHSSGLGLEAGDPVTPVGARRVYSNVGVDLAVDAVVGESDAASWLDRRIFSPLGMSATRLEGRPSAGVVGSTADLATLAVAWLRPDAVSIPTRDRMIAPYRPALDGVVPGFGRYSPCPWGLGPELAGDKHHWMGDWPPESFGHFGQSGALVLLNARERLGVVATSGAPFGAWAIELWPRWVSGVRAHALAS
jgi:CubicO group peptidase (beta-lactamase class C family)